MSSVKRIGELGGQLQHKVERQRSAQEPVRERLAGNILHDEELELVLGADVESAQICGFVSFETARASRLNRSRCSGSAAASAVRIL